jgi:hypothetical protein
MAMYSDVTISNTIATTTYATTPQKNRNNGAYSQSQKEKTNTECCFCVFIDVITTPIMKISRIFDGEHNIVDKNSCAQCLTPTEINAENKRHVISNLNQLRALLNTLDATHYNYELLFKLICEIETQLTINHTLEAMKVSNDVLRICNTYTRTLAQAELCEFNTHLLTELLQSRAHDSPSIHFSCTTKDQLPKVPTVDFGDGIRKCAIVVVPTAPVVIT